MKKLLISSAALALIAFPMLVLAQTSNSNIETFIGEKLVGIVNNIIKLLIAIATLVFIYGIIMYIAAGGDETKMKTARSYIVFSIIGLALILGIWGVATFLVEGFGFDTSTAPTIPDF